MRYFKTIMNLGLHNKKFPVVLKGYNNADWNSFSEYSKSTSDYIFSVVTGVVSWKSKKHTILPQSTVESKMVAQATVSEDSDWLRSLLVDLPLWERSIPAILSHCWLLQKFKTVTTTARNNIYVISTTLLDTLSIKGLLEKIMYVLMRT